MPKNKIIVSLGVLIALLPVLGFPTSWESTFQIITGLSIVGLSVWTTIDKKISQKAKARSRQARKQMIEERRAEQEEIIPVVASAPEFSEEENALGSNPSI